MDKLPIKLLLTLLTREAEVPAAAFRVHWAMCLAYDAACLPFGMVGEPRRKLSPITILVLLLSMGVDLMDIRVSAVFPSLRQRAAFHLSPRSWLIQVQLSWLHAAACSVPGYLPRLQFRRTATGGGAVCSAPDATPPANRAGRRLRRPRRRQPSRSGGRPSARCGSWNAPLALLAREPI